MYQQQTVRQVLIAHQSTIPHYRVSFYNTLESLRPSSWRFDVVFDPSEAVSPRFFKEPLDVRQFRFPVLKVDTLSLRLSSKTISYQTFWRRAAGYDLIIVENAVNNLTYPLCALHQLHGTKVAYWGHGKDRGAVNLSILKRISEQLKLLLTRRADGFFAYTPGVKNYLMQRGLSPEKVFAINNTIDIDEQRRAFERNICNREVIRQQLNVRGKKVLLFVGRFSQNKRIDFLLRAFSLLCARDSDFHLLLVGSGGESFLANFSNAGVADKISYLGPVVDLDRLALAYLASDVFAFPGSVGLGPLQALCYDLPVITIASATHMPEIEYLLPTNSIVLDAFTQPEQYAQAIVDLFDDPLRLNSLRSGAWPSIQHLTVQHMARNFIEGVNKILDT
jgi:glycosyltransferase involved in cell wall biosynthesis